MKNINHNVPVSQVVLDYPETRSLLEIMGIDYCCGGRRPLHLAAEEAGYRPEDVVAKLETRVEEAKSGPAEKKDFANMPLDELADHIYEVHHVYLEHNLPRITALLERVYDAHKDRHGKLLAELSKRFHLLRTDIEMHLAKEEQILFPMIKQMEAYRKGVARAPEMHCGTVNNPINQMEHEHDTAGDILADMRRITDNYACPDDACASFRSLYEALPELEDNLHEHIHLENNLLFPKAAELEHSLHICE